MSRQDIAIAVRKIQSSAIARFQTHIHREITAGWHRATDRGIHFSQFLISEAGEVRFGANRSPV